MKDLRRFYMRLIVGSQISLIVLLSFALAGCNQIQVSDEIDIPQTTITPTSTPTPIPTDEITPAPTQEEPEENTDTLEELIQKMDGVWGNLTGGCYYEYYDGGKISSGWFESDALPNCHIKEVTKTFENIYKVIIDVDEMYDEDGELYEAYSYEATYDGTADGFKTSFIASNDKTDYLYIRLGDNMEDAWDYYCGDFVEDFKKLSETYKGKLRESPVGRWYTDGYDVNDNWAGSYYLEFHDDGTALCEGYRNRDTGTYEIMEPGKLRITFDHCECDDPSVGGWALVDGFKYTIDMDYSGDDATIKIDAPDVISNLVDGEIHRR